MTDVRAAIGALISARAFSVVAILTLTSGLALAAAILTVVNAYVFRPLPYPNAERLYRVDYAPPGGRLPDGMEALDWSALGDVIEAPISWDLDVFYLLGRDYPESAPGAWVSPAYMRALGVRVAIGRGLAADDYRTGTPPVALISHRLWQTQFDGDADIVGRTFHAYVSDRPAEPETFTVIGVLAPDLWHLNAYTEVLAPLREPGYPYQVLLHRGVAPALAVSRIDGLVRSGVSSVPAEYRVVLTSLQDSYTAQLRPMFWAVTAAAVLVLAIAAANVSVLMIVRARNRERELAIRLALGATKWRVARLVTLEGVLVGLVSTALGLLVAVTTMPAVAPLLERALDRRVPGGLHALAVDARVAGLVILCSLAVALMFTIMPAAIVWRSRHAIGAGAFTRGATSNVSASRSRALLIGLEVAASLALLMGAALMTESAFHMLRVDFGFDGNDVVTAGLALRQQSFPTMASRAEFYRRAADELGGVPGMTSIALGDWWPLQGSRPGRVEKAGTAPVAAMASSFGVSPGYFTTLGIRLIEGRTFTPQDDPGTAPVVIVSASLASRLSGRESAVGQRLTIYRDGEGETITATIIGVVNDVRQSHADNDLLDAYLPLAYRAGRFAFVYMRGSPAPSFANAVRSAIGRINPEVALSTPRALNDGLEQERARPRMLAFLLAAFAAFAWVLALVGMHGVIAYAVGQRRREIAVRMAIGADPRAVRTMFLRQGLVVLASGLAAGGIGALAMGRVLQSQLFGVRPAEPRVLALSVVVFGGVALAAILQPAWRASSVDPLLALREE